MNRFTIILLTALSCAQIVSSASQSLSAQQRKSLIIRATGKSIQGLRDYQQDKFAIDPDRHLYSVWDGHGNADGDVQAVYAAKNFSRMYDHAPARSEESKLSAVLLTLDQFFKTKGHDKVGTVCAVTKITEDELTIAHVGDVRTLVFDEQGKLIVETRDHSPEGLELERIEAHGAWLYDGHYVASEHAPRGTVNMTRVLGDHEHKRILGQNILIARPSRYIGPVKPGYTILMASDGWTHPYDYVKGSRPQDLAQVHALITGRDMDIQAKANQLIHFAQEISRRHLYHHNDNKDEKRIPLTDTDDNTTAVIIEVAGPKTPPGAAEEKASPLDRVRDQIEAQSADKVECGHIKIKQPKKWWPW